MNKAMKKVVMWTCAMTSLHQRNPEVELKAEWNVHFGAHQYWKQKLFQDFKVNNTHEVLNAEPPIDHEEFYNSTFPEYFKTGTTVQWIHENFDAMPPSMRISAHEIAIEECCFVAAYDMCHPKARVGKFGLPDVLQLHDSLSYTPHAKFLKARGTTIS